MDNIPLWAEKRIEKAKNKKSNSLDLTYPVDFYLNYEKLTSIPADVFMLNNLELLNLAGNGILKIPDEIGQLRNLKMLRIPSNNLQIISPKIKDLELLHFIDVDNNPLDSIPDVFFHIKGLKYLSIDDNFIRSISSEISLLHELEVLSLERNLLTEIPEAIYKLKSLKKLSFANTKNLYSYTKFQNRNKNRISEISPALLELTNLEELNIAENQIDSLPPELLNIRGYGFVDIQRLRSYFANLETEGIDYLYEAKLIIVGEGGAGKTSLTKKIIDSAYKLKHEEETTRGVDIFQWKFPINSTNVFRVNIWDFAGQAIYHSTHRYFLTNRSLYILLLETRKEDTDLYYWLNIIELLSANCPLIIVINEKDDRFRDIPGGLFRNQFTNIKNIMVTNLATNRGLEDIVNEIKKHITQLPHIGKPLPKTWVKVRLALEKDSRDYIDAVDFFRICDQNGFTKIEDKLQLSGYLHDLGVCLHFQNDDLLKKCLILNPSWGTEAAYKVLENNAIRDNGGIFTRDDLEKIWISHEYTGMSGELLRLMENFKLCYEIPYRPGYYVAPQLLSEDHPDYKWNDNSNLLIRYKYEFMPKGILHQFIVVMNSYIVRQKLVWKSGVVLEKLLINENYDDNTQIELIEYYDYREIRIRLSGRYMRETLSIINYELDKIHKSYRGLKYKKYIACVCPKCKISREPFFYDFDTLRRFASDKQLIQCQLSYQMVDVSELLEFASWSNLPKVSIENNIPNGINFVVKEIKEMHTGDKLDVKVKNVKNKNGQLLIGKFDQTHANLVNSGQKEFAEALNNLKDSILSSTLISDNTKNESIEVVNQIGEEASKDKPNRTMLKMLGEGLLTLLKSVPDIAEAITTITPFLLK